MGVPGFQSDRFRDGFLRIGQLIPFPLDCRQGMKTKRFIRGVMNCLLCLRGRFVKLVPLGQAKCQQGVSRRGLGPFSEGQSQLLFRQFKPVLLHQKLGAAEMNAHVIFKYLRISSYSPP